MVQTSTRPIPSHASAISEIFRRGSQQLGLSSRIVRHPSKYRRVWRFLEQFALQPYKCICSFAVHRHQVYPKETKKRIGSILLAGRLPVGGPRKALSEIAIANEHLMPKDLFWYICDLRDKARQYTETLDALPECVKESDLLWCEQLLQSPKSFGETVGDSSLRSSIMMFGHCQLLCTNTSTMKV